MLRCRYCCCRYVISMYKHILPRTLKSNNCMVQITLAYPNLFSNCVVIPASLVCFWRWYFMVARFVALLVWFWRWYFMIACFDASFVCVPGTYLMIACFLSLLLLFHINDSGSQRYTVGKLRVVAFQRCIAELVTSSSTEAMAWSVKPPPAAHASTHNHAKN